MMFLQMLKAKLTGQDQEMYRLQSESSWNWITTNSGVTPQSHPKVLDLCCGNGAFGGRLRAMGFDVTYADLRNWLSPEFANQPFTPIDLNSEELSKLGKFDFVIFSNALEHIGNPAKLISELHQVLNENGMVYLAWTNWLSLYGGHEFAPLHYLGYRFANALFPLTAFGRKRHHTLGKDLNKTYIGTVLKQIRSNKEIEIAAMAPRFFKNLKFVVQIPILREFVCWNLAMIIRKK